MVHRVLGEFFARFFARIRYPGAKNGQAIQRISRCFLCFSGGANNATSVHAHEADAGNADAYHRKKFLWRSKMAGQVWSVLAGHECRYVAIRSNERERVAGHGAIPPCVR
jgi:hypothetical protein